MSSRFPFSQRCCLRNVFIAILAVIIRPAVNGRNLTRPVSMTRLDGSCPFDGIGFPRIWSLQLSSYKNTGEKVYDKQNLSKEHQHGSEGDEFVQCSKHVERLECIERIIPSG